MADSKPDVVLSAVGGAVRPAGERLPRGRHKLSQEQVLEDQRERVLRATVDAVAARGFHAATVGQIVAAARVSRATFYELYDDKDHAYWSAFERFTAPLLRNVNASAVDPSAPSIERLEQALGDYLQFLASDPAATRCYLLERPGRAGEPTPQQRRVSQIAQDAILTMFDDTTPFICETYLAIVRHHMIVLVLANRTTELPQLLHPIMVVARRLFAST